MRKNHSFSRLVDHLFLVNFPKKRELLNDIEAHLSSSKGFTVATLNLDHVTKLRRDPSFVEAYSRHSHVVADGNPIVWLRSLMGYSVERVPGSELVSPLVALASQVGAPVALIASTSELLEMASNRLLQDNPNLNIVARIAPPFGFDPESKLADDIIEEISNCGARLCLLGFGAPKQEKFAIRASARVPDCGFVSIGSALEFTAGTQRRAPRWIQSLAMEWLWRMLGDPKRLAPRYAECFRILPGLLIGALRMRWQSTDLE